MKSSLPSSLLLSLTLTSLATAANIESSTITQVVKDATVLQPTTKGKKTARVNDIFGVPDVLRTGADSRVEMVAEDQTVTRVGANTIFSFEPQKREINLQKGSVLFNSPTGKGGGTIRTAAATAAVQGTTLIVVTTQNGGFKTLLLEGRGVVKSNGKTRSIGAGQMVYVLPGGDLSGVLNFHLAEQVGVARLVNGFKTPLASKDKIERAVAKQEAQIAKGQLVTTGLLASDSPTQAYKVDNTIAVDVVREQKRAVQQQGQQITSSAQAGLLDVTITQPQLDANRIYTAASDIAGLFPGTTVGDIPPSTSVFFARNLTVATNTIDLASYPGTFLLFSTGDFIVEQSFSLTGGLDEIGIVVGGTLRQKAGSFIDIDAKSAFVYGFGLGNATGESFPTGTPLSLAGGGIRSTGDLFVFGSGIDLNQSALVSQNGVIDAFTQGDLTAVGFGADAPQFVAPEGVSLFAGNNMDISKSVFSTLGVNLRAQNNLTLDTVAFTTAGGPAANTHLTAGSNMSLSTVAFRSANVSLDAQNMRLVQVGFFPGATNAGNANLTAPGAMFLGGVNFQSQNVALESRTIALSNVAFAAQSNVTLRSQTGLLATRPNTGQPVELGKVNFIQSVTYGGKPAQNFIDRSITLTK